MDIIRRWHESDRRVNRDEEKNQGIDMESPVNHGTSGYGVRFARITIANKNLPPAESEELLVLILCGSNKSLFCTGDSKVEMFRFANDDSKVETFSLRERRFQSRNGLPLKSTTPNSKCFRLEIGEYKVVAFSL